MSLRTYLICRIIFTSLFLIISTIIWSNRRVEIYHNLEGKVSINQVEFRDISKESNKDDQIYYLKLENKDNDAQNIKLYVVSDIMKNNIDNNYIKYQINDKDVKTLNMDGMILVDKMQSQEEKEIKLKLWISDTYNGDLSYSGRVVVA